MKTTLQTLPSLKDGGKLSVVEKATEQFMQQAYTAIDELAQGLAVPAAGVGGAAGWGFDWIWDCNALDCTADNANKITNDSSTGQGPKRFPT